MGKMGMANRITEERYNKAKVELKTPKDDERVMKKYGFGAATARRIRNTDNFYEYYQKGTTGRTKRDHLQTLLADSQEPERKPSEDVLDDYKLEYEDMHRVTTRTLAFCVIVLGSVLLVMVGTIIFIMGAQK